jgi:transposase
MEDLKKIIEEKDRIIAAQAKMIEELQVRIAALERRLNIDSSNSSKPPSADGYKKPRRSLRQQTGKKSGGQPGHVGKTLGQIDNPDIVKQYDVNTCVQCGESLSEVIGAEERRQVFDIKIDRQIIEHRALIKKCKCGIRNSAMPKDIKAPIQYSSQVKAMASYLSTSQLLPKARTAEMFDDIFGIPISEASLVTIDSECAKKLEEFDRAAVESIKQAVTKHADETGTRIAKKLWWMHVLSNEIMTHYRVSPKRGELLSDIIGVIIHDHWKPYFTLPDVLHALCNAHHVRELKAIVEYDKEPWAKDMTDLLIESSRLESPTLIQQQSISDRYDQIIMNGFALHATLDIYKPGSRKKRPALNLLIRLRDFKTETLRFLYDTTAPFTNNLAERDLRMIKVKQKISGSFRSEQGARDFARTRSLISTSKKQHKNVFSALTSVFDGSFNVADFVPGWIHHSSA